MSDKLISIALATFNGEKFLREQLDSIYKQTYKNIEVVVCDDCSTDNTIGILEEYKQKYGLRYYINEENLGRSKNFEKILTLCRGEYIAFSDQDDIWLPEKLEILLNEIGDYSLIHSDASIINQYNRQIAVSHKNYFNIKKFAQNSDKFAGKITSCVWGCTSLFNREILEKALPIPKSIFSRKGQVFSHDFWISAIAQRLNGIKYLDMQLICWKLHDKNSSQQHKMFPRKIFILLFGDVYRFLRSLEVKLILKSRSL